MVQYRCMHFHPWTWTREISHGLQREKKQIRSVATTANFFSGIIYWCKKIPHTHVNRLRWKSLCVLCICSHFFSYKKKCKMVWQFHSTILAYLTIFASEIVQKNSYNRVPWFLYSNGRNDRHKRFVNILKCVQETGYGLECVDGVCVCVRCYCIVLCCWGIYYATLLFPKCRLARTSK